MANGRYEVRRVSLIPELFATLWVEEDVAIGDGVQMTEQELRASLRMNHGRSDAEIDQIVEDARTLLI